MKLSLVKKSMVLLAGLGLMTLVSEGVSTAQSQLPNPSIMFVGQEFYETGGKQFTRYRYRVDNPEAYPNELFAAAPDLPPCGANTKASRTWVDIYDSTGKRLNGFCALGNTTDLGQLWFATDRDAIPPSWIYIEFTDRKTGTKYKSALAETTM
ncbi:MAG TPA: hypothetical protein VJT82_02495 [Pyrinomonadaceae bacterium]|nr:hypothetical protein [Pyrinomonadaceae bacterium]